ncbi:hypothetical protein BDZ91DRAFT_768068 [Kalaharituber pfeilii]|nr:hypothetical protein BDZ91DRAFT_768068 [Kalaharituber pfeilii]
MSQMQCPGMRGEFSIDIDKFHSYLSTTAFCTVLVFASVQVGTSRKKYQEGLMSKKENGHMDAAGIEEETEDEDGYFEEGGMVENIANPAFGILSGPSHVPQHRSTKWHSPYRLSRRGALDNIADSQGEGKRCPKGSPEVRLKLQLTLDPVGEDVGGVAEEGYCCAGFEVEVGRAKDALEAV